MRLTIYRMLFYLNRNHRLYRLIIRFKVVLSFRRISFIKIYKISRLEKRSLY